MGRCDLGEVLLGVDIKVIMGRTFLEREGMARLAEEGQGMLLSLNILMSSSSVGRLPSAYGSIEDNSSSKEWKRLYH